MTTVSPAQALRTLELELNAQDYLRRFRAVGASPSAPELLARCRAAHRSVPPQAEPIRTGYLLRADPAASVSAQIFRGAHFSARRFILAMRHENRLPRRREGEKS